MKCDIKKEYQTTTYHSLPQVLTFEQGNISSFPAPKRGSTGVLSKSRVFI